MNINGYSDDNYHDGNTAINGTLTVSGNIISGGSSVQSEYLDSGDYTNAQFIIGTDWVSMALQPFTKYRYSKNGNMISVHMNLTAEIKAGTLSLLQCEVRVPGIDIFGIKGATEGVYSDSSIVASNGQIFTIRNMQMRYFSPNQASGILIYFQATTSAPYIQQIVNFSLNLYYKLEAVDVPASVLVVGGGSGAGVQNPMLSTLNCGGFDLTNIGNVQATTFNGGGLLTNPLQNNLLMGFNNISNIKDISVNNIYTNTNQAINIFNDTVYNEKKIYQLQSVENLGLDYTIKTGNMIMDTTSINMNNNNISNANQLFIKTLQPYTGNTLIDVKTRLAMNTNNIIGVGSLLTNSIYSNAPGTAIQVQEDITMNEKKIYQLTGITNLGLDLILKASSVSMDATPLNMNNNNITNGGTITTNSLLVKSIGIIKYVYTAADLPTSLGGTYMICDQILLTGSSTYTVANDCSFIGFGRDTSGLIFINPSFSGVLSCLNIGNHNVSFFNLRLGNQSTLYNLLTANNPAKDKNFCMLNCYVSGCRGQSIMSITGYDIIDLNQLVYENNYPTINQLLISGTAKCQISNCTFYKQFQDVGGGGGGVSGTAPMMEITGACGSINVSGSVFAPYLTQDGVKLNVSLTTPSLVVSSNTFTDAGLTTGKLLNYVENIGYCISSNSGILDDRALLAGISISNTVYTATILATYVGIDFGPDFTVTTINRFVPSLTPYAFIYNAKQPIYVSVNVNITADHGTGGLDLILFTLLKNNQPTSITSTSISATSPSTFGFNCIIPVVYGDTLRFGVQNTTAGTNAQGFRAVAFNGSLSQV